MLAGDIQEEGEDESVDDSVDESVDGRIEDEIAAEEVRAPLHFVVIEFFRDISYITIFWTIVSVIARKRLN